MSSPELRPGYRDTVADLSWYWEVSLNPSFQTLLPEASLLASSMTLSRKQRKKKTTQGIENCAVCFTSARQFWRCLEVNLTLPGFPGSEVKPQRT